MMVKCKLSCSNELPGITAWFFLFFVFFMDSRLLIVLSHSAQEPGAF